MKNLFKFLFVTSLAVFAVSCEDYDDSKLSGRVDELEDRVDSHDALLAQLQANIKSLNDANAAFTALLNGGVITDVQTIDENGRTGYAITVVNSQGSTTYKIFNGKDGKDGEDGQPGAPGTPGTDGVDGTAPELTVKYEEETGRYYWVLDGDPLDDGQGGKVYASGEKGEKGDDGAPGVTPMFKAEKDASTPEDQQIYWWVSTDGEGNEWQKLSPITGDVTTVSGANMEYNAGDQTVTFSLGEQQYTFDVMPVKFTVEGKDKTHFYNGETKTYTYEIGEQDAANYLVKVSLQNANGDFSVDIDSGKKQISVTAKKAGAKNVVDVELVKQNGTCKHIYFEVAADVRIMSFTNNNETLLTGTGAGYSDAPIGITFDLPLAETVTFNVEVETTLPDGSYTTIPKTLQVESGSDSAQIDYTVDGSKLTAGTGYTLTVTLSTESEMIALETDTYNAVLASEAKKQNLTKENYSSPFDGASEENDPGHIYNEGGSIAALCDGQASPHFGSAYWSVDAFTTYTEEIKEYGVWVDVNLPEKVKWVLFRFQQRKGNGKVVDYKIGVGADGSALKVAGTGTAENQDGAGWNTTDAYPVPDGSQQKARFGVTRSDMGSLTDTPVKSMAIAELEVWVLK